MTENSDGSRPYSLRITIAGATFDATGPKDEVQAAYREFLDLVKAAPATAPQPDAPPAPPAPLVTPTGDAAGGGVPSNVARIFRNDPNGPLSLTATPTSDEDCVLLLLLGYGLLRGELSVTAPQLGAALSKTGRQMRVERVVGRMPNMVAASGVKRGKLYSLKNPGEARAREVLAKVLA